jgi:hypothetical protein
LNALAVPNCVLVEGGTQAWIDAGLPVNRGGSCTKSGAKEIPSLNLQVTLQASGLDDLCSQSPIRMLVGSYQGALIHACEMVRNFRIFTTVATDYLLQVYRRAEKRAKHRRTAHKDAV